jgi:hypothetical protein
MAAGFVQAWGVPLAPGTISSDEHATALELARHSKTGDGV